MTTATRFEELDVWQNAKELTSLIYQLSAPGTFARDFGLRDQMRRTAVSIMSNIAEGLENQIQVMFIQYCSLRKDLQENFVPSFISPSNRNICQRKNSNLHSH